MSQSKKIRYGVVGLGYISQAAVLPAFKNAGANSKLTALISTDPGKLKNLGRKYGVKNLYNFEDYEECLKGGEIDAIYIATPNDKHKQLVELAAHYGIHVLCEKPFAVDESACQTMIEVGKSTGIKTMVAYRLHFDPANLKAIDLARKRRLGPLKLFSSTFTMQVRDRGNIRLQSEEVGGGPLFDIGIYCINTARSLFQAEPVEVYAFAGESGDPRFKNSPEMVSASMKFPNGELATFTVSFGAADSSAYDLIGTKSRLHVENAYDYAQKTELTVFTDGKTTKMAFKKRDQFAPELLYFSDCILKNKTPEPSGLEGLADVRVIRALQQSIQQNVPVYLSQLDGLRKSKWPTMKQRISRPAQASAPHIYHAKEPGNP